MFFFVVAPFCSCPASLVSRIFLLSAPGVQSVCFFVALRWAPRPFGGARAKKNTQGVFFVAPAPGKGRGRRSPVPARGQSKKKNTLGGVFFLLRPRADAHSLTAGLGGDASPSPGWCFFFCCGPARTGVVFFFLLWPRPDAHSLTVGWGDFGRARVVFFFLLRPRRVFLDNNKKCLGYYIESKKTRRGHSKKKNTTSGRLSDALEAKRCRCTCTSP